MLRFARGIEPNRCANDALVGTELDLERAVRVRDGREAGKSCVLRGEPSRQRRDKRPAPVRHDDRNAKCLCVKGSAAFKHAVERGRVFPSHRESGCRRAGGGGLDDKVNRRLMQGRDSLVKEVFVANADTNAANLGVDIVRIVSRAKEVGFDGSRRRLSDAASDRSLRRGKHEAIEEVGAISLDEAHAKMNGVAVRHSLEPDNARAVESLRRLPDVLGEEIPTRHQLWHQHQFRTFGDGLLYKHFGVRQIFRSAERFATHLNGGDFEITHNGSSLRDI